MSSPIVWPGRPHGDGSGLAAAVAAVVAAPDALAVLDALKPGFSLASLSQRGRMQERLSGGDLGDARRLLCGAALLERAGSEWRIPEGSRRLAFLIATSMRDESLLAERLSADARLSHDSRWLDVACGSGALLRSVRRVAGCESVGVDLDRQALAVAHWVDEAHGYRIGYACAAAHVLPVADGSVDVVTSLMSLQHFQVSAALQEMARVMRPGGLLHLSLHGTGYYWELASRYLRRGVIPVYPMRCLWHGLRVSGGRPQNLAVQDGWLKFEIPVSPTWMRSALQRTGVSVDQCRVRRAFAGRPVFFEVTGHRQ